MEILKGRDHLIRYLEGILRRFKDLDHLNRYLKTMEHNTCGVVSEFPIKIGSICESPSNKPESIGVSINEC